MTLIVQKAFRYARRDGRIAEALPGDVCPEDIGPLKRNQLVDNLYLSDPDGVIAASMGTNQYQRDAEQRFRDAVTARNATVTNLKADAEIGLAQTRARIAQKVG